MTPETRNALILEAASTIRKAALAMSARAPSVDVDEATSVGTLAVLEALVKFEERTESTVRDFAYVIAANAIRSHFGLYGAGGQKGKKDRAAGYAEPLAFHASNLVDDSSPISELAQHQMSVRILAAIEGLPESQRAYVERVVLSDEREDRWAVARELGLSGTKMVEVLRAIYAQAAGHEPEGRRLRKASGPTRSAAWYAGLTPAQKARRTEMNRARRERRRMERQGEAVAA